jgi:flagellin-like hook-associated protein FlgL
MGIYTNEIIVGIVVFTISVVISRFINTKDTINNKLDKEHDKNENKIIEKLDKLIDEIHQIGITLAVSELRHDSHEARISKLEDEVLKIKNDVINKLLR